MLPSYNKPLELINPESKSTIFSVEYIDSPLGFEKTGKYNVFVIILVLEGRGKIIADTNEYVFQNDSLITLSLYQPFNITALENFKGIITTFHPEFFCLHRHRREVSCNGILFNNIYESPVMNLSQEEAGNLLHVLRGMESEMQRIGRPDADVLISYLKILLIDASRLKLLRRGETSVGVDAYKAELIDKLQAAIEEHFRSQHSPAYYAKLLHFTPSGLNRFAKEHFNKTLTKLVTERLITEGKRELYLTAKPIKQVAYELGFNDEFYFSRFFKKNAGISPQFFRDKVGFDKAAG